MPSSFFPDWTDTERTRPRFTGDRGALARELQREIRGDVRFDSAHQALFATDASNYRQVPLGVIFPRDKEDLVEAVRICARHGAPITHRGGGTSLAGQTANEAVVIDSSKYVNRIIEIDGERRIARVEPGVIRDQLNDLTVERHGLTFGPDTSTHAWATFGGMIGNNACGVHSEMAGKTVDSVDELEILLYDGTRMRVGATAEEDLEAIIAAGGRRGEIYRGLRDIRDRYADLIRQRYPDIPRRVSGFNLDHLLPENGFHVARALVGSEGTLVTVLEATVSLVPWPSHRVLLVLGFSGIAESGDAVPDVKRYTPIGLEGMDDRLLAFMEEKGLFTEHLHLLPEGKGFLLAEFGGDSLEEARERAEACREGLSAAADAPVMRLIEDLDEQEQVWKIRESALGATAHPLEGHAWEGWEDAAVAPERLGDYLRGLLKLYEKYGFDASVYGHFGQGCVHSRIPFDLESENGIRAFRSFMDEASDLCMEMGGSLSGEHGDGQARGELLPKMFGDELIEAFREFKQIWDPDWKMNPGKVVEPYRIDDNLRIGPGRPKPSVDVHFGYEEDNGDFTRVTSRCVGVGKCRKLDLDGDEVMCPSYLATRDEMHTTRGRAHLLFEMLHSDGGSDVWQDENVKEALDLCLACKGCKSDCPVKVDMATYKAEFLSHYYEGRLRPITAYTMGLIMWWARLASMAPGVVNRVGKSRVFGPLLRRLGGIAPKRELPQFTEQTFRSWWAMRARPDSGVRTGARSCVVLFPDTFTNFFEPDIGRAAVQVLEDAGFEVTIPAPLLCCGRPLYDFGMLDLARRQWEQILDALAQDIEAGTPVIGLEPSCVAAFRDELPNLMHDRPDARRLAKLMFTLTEFLGEKADGYEPREVGGRALVHGHCHHKAVMDYGAQRDMLQRTGLDCDFLAAGCCGMAGSFGFERDHYDVSMACGEYRLLPAVREAPTDALIIADGFSCRHQIQEGTGRRAVHIAEVLAGWTNGERAHEIETRENGRMKSFAAVGGALAAGVLAGFASDRWT